MAQNNDLNLFNNFLSARITEIFVVVFMDFFQISELSFMDIECLGECIPLNCEQSCLWPINLKGPFSAFKKGGEARG